MQSTVENLGALERRLVISIAKEQVQKEVDASLKRLSKTAKIHGFRPGKVPLKIIAQQYGAQIEQDALKDALQKEFREVIKDQGIKIAGYPRFENKSKKDVDDKESDDRKFEFVALFEVYPEITLGDLSGVNVEQPVVDVEDSDVDKTLGILRKQRTTYEPVDRAVALDDRVNVDYRGTLDGAEFEGGKAEGASIIVGEGKFLKSFEESVVGMSKGETKSFEVVFPDDYHGKEIAGKTVTFEVTLNSVDVPKLPELDADFAKSLGLADGDEKKMREEIKANLEREILKRVRTKLKDQVMQAILDSANIEAPKALIDQEIQRLVEEARENYEERGMKFDASKITPELFQTKADYRVKLGLILAELVKVNELKAQPEQVRKVIEDSAQSYENPEEVVKWHYSSPDRLQEAQSVVLEDNVVMWVLQQVKVVDKKTTFDELMGIT